MSSRILAFHKMEHSIFGICPECEEFFRLSDSHIYLKKRPAVDWMSKLDHSMQRMDEQEQRLEEKMEELREIGREKGRRLADLRVRQVDQVFTPRKLNPNDAKILFHPIDYIIFDGMNEGCISNVILLDRRVRPPELSAVQQSIRAAVEECRYKWQTLRATEDGAINLE